MTRAVLALAALIACPLAASQGHADLVMQGLKWRELGPARGGRSVAVSGVPGRPGDETAVVRADASVTFTDSQAGMSKSFTVPGWAQLRAVRVTSEERRLTFRFDAPRPKGAGGRLWVEAFFWPDEDRSSEQVAVYAQIAGLPSEAPLVGRVVACDAVIWRKGIGARLVKVSGQGLEPFVELPDGLRPSLRLQRVTTFWVPEEADPWLEGMSFTPAVGTYARPSSQQMGALLRFTDVAGPSLRRLRDPD